jgi:GNAT superfamily N-acetyltransferase
LKIVIQQGYKPGLIGQVVSLHAAYYAREYGFGQHFESKVAAGLAEFAGRLNSSRNAIWSVEVDGKIAGSIAIDGEDMGLGVAHLRWFIMSDHLRAKGVGQSLLAAALQFSDQSDFASTHLWTFKGLNAARHLYEKNGFVLSQEAQDCTWGPVMTEQLFVRTRPR